MALESTRRHRRIFKLQAKIAGAIMLGIMALTGGSVAKQVSDNNAASEAVAQTSEQRDFWRIVAGRDLPRGVTVRDIFASDLRDKLKEPPVENGLPQSINSFKAGANQYGGIENELGFNPFDNSGLPCKVCGSLNGYMIEQLRQVKSGQSAFLNEVESTTGDSHIIDFTPVHLPNVLWFGFVYLAAGTAALVLAVRRDTKTHNYNSLALNWKQDGGSTSDPYKLMSKALSPAYFILVLPLKGKKHPELLAEMNLSEAHRELVEQLQLLRSLPTPSDRLNRERIESQIVAIEELLGKVDVQVDQFVGHPISSRATRNIPIVLDDGDQVISRNGLVIQARSEALRELEQSSNPQMPNLETSYEREHQEPPQTQVR